ncbi:hypothetical protein K0A97_03150 [Patescibacteria group bacterium]|nr:hypothetical protein [Patescibacteria group bacterium]
MKGKQVGAVIALIVMIPALLWIIRISFNPNNPEVLEQGVEVIANSAVPWWTNLLTWFAGLPGIIGAGLIIGLIFFLKWIGEIN